MPRSDVEHCERCGIEFVGNQPEYMIICNDCRDEIGNGGE